MKKTLLIAAVLLALAGCSDNQSTNPNPNVIEFERYSFGVQKACHEGLLYVLFAGGSSTWGSVQFNRVTGKPETCEK